MNNKELYTEITERMIEKLKSGYIPWRKPWGVDENGNPNLPRNFVSKKLYRGINIWILGMAGFTSPYWMTFNQAKERKGFVKAGSKATKVYFWQFIKRQDKDENGKPKMKNGIPVIVRVPVLRVYNVFNLEQIDGIEAPKVAPMPEKTELQKIESCESIVNGYSIQTEFGGNRACYSPSKDKISLPLLQNFSKSEEYYSTYFHEIVHSTGHKTRLAREGVTNFDFFGTHRYSKEELVAEFGASFLCAQAGIVGETLENSAGYIQSWIQQLQHDPAMLIQSAGQAQKACDLVLGISFEEKESEETESVPSDKDLSLVA